MNNLSPPQGTQAAIRTIRLLKAFTADQPELSLGELSRRIGLNKTTAHRLLAALESESLVERSSARGNYRLGPATVALGAQAQSTNYLRVCARPALERLAKLTQETATLEVLLGADVLILDAVDGGRVVSATGYVGTRWPAHATSTGKAILACLDPAKLSLPSSFTQFTDRTLTTPESLNEELRRVRKHGFACVCDELEDGYSAVAVAISELGLVRSAISVGGPSARFRRDRRAELGRILQREAATLQRSGALMSDQ